MCVLREGALGGRLFCKPSCALLNLSTISQCDGSAIAAEQTPELSKTPAVRTGGRTHGKGYWPSSSRSYPDRRDEGRSLRGVIGKASRRGTTRAVDPRDGQLLCGWPVAAPKTLAETLAVLSPDLAQSM